MEYNEFDIEAFKKNSEQRRTKLRKYLLIKEQKRQKRMKVVKRIIVGGTTVIIMGVGVINYFPSMFEKTETKVGGIGYRNSQTMDEKREYSTLTAIENTQDTTKYSAETINTEASALEKLTESTENETEATEKSTEKATEKATEKSTEKATEAKKEIKMVVGGNGDDQVAQFLNSDIGQHVYDYSDCYGVDPNIIASICMQESSLEHERCCPGGDMYSGYGVGICQLESPDGSLEVTAHNYNTGEDDSVVVTMENACDIEKNIQISCMLFQNSLNNFNGNVLLAIQSHNYGKYMLDVILNRNYDNPEQVKNDYSNISWIEYVKYAHFNPKQFIDNWDLGEYGDEEYINHVLSHCPSKEVSYKYNNQQISFKLDTLETTNVEDLKNHVKIN